MFVISLVNKTVAGKSLEYNEPKEQRQTAFSIETYNNMSMVSLMGGWGCGWGLPIVNGLLE